jgi:hypothetical protein
VKRGLFSFSVVTSRSMGTRSVPAVNDLLCLTGDGEKSVGSCVWGRTEGLRFVF